MKQSAVPSESQQAISLVGTVQDLFQGLGLTSQSTKGLLGSLSGLLGSRMIFPRRDPDPLDFFQT